MSTRRAKAEVMDALHKALAETFTKILTEGEVVVDKETGEPVRVTPGASTLNAVRQFLKDNGIDSAPGQSPSLNELGTRLANLPFPVHTDEHGLNH